MFVSLQIEAFIGSNHWDIYLQSNSDAPKSYILYFVRGFDL